MEKLLHTARARLLRMHYEARVGHIGGNLSCLDAMMVVHHEYMNADNRFILSKGHSAGALYTTLWSTGFLQDADLCSFHQDNTLLPGHPPANSIAGIDFATGSLGHGLSLAAGSALALKLKRKAGHVFCLSSDGEWQEGSTWEALIFARHHKLDNLTVLIDHNQLQGFGNTTDVASMGALWEKLIGFDCHLDVIDGHNVEQIRNALNQVIETQRAPHIIVLKTVKGHGVSFMENKMEWHYLPLNQAQYEQALSELDCGVGSNNAQI